MRRYKTAIFMCFSLLCSIMSFADTTDTINTTEAAVPVSVVVPDQSAASLQTGLQAAFSQWMIQTSHDPQIMTQPAVQEAAKNVMQWVQRYQYAAEAASDSSTQTVTLLQVVFDRTATQSLIPAFAKTAEQNTTHSSDNTTAELYITVFGIHNMQDYTQALHALREKSNVKNVVANEIGSDQVQFTITVAGNTDHFLQDISSDYHFRVRADDFQPVGMKTQSQQFTWTRNQT